MGDLFDLFKVLLGKRFPFQLVYSNEYWMVETGKPRLPPPEIPPRLREPPGHGS